MPARARIGLLAGKVMLAAVLLAASAVMVPARADVADCERAYQLGRKDEAIRLCRRAAWQENDFFAQVKLGDIYSAKREDDKGYYDPVEAYVWYFMAAHNSAIFDHFHLDAAADFVVTKLASAENEAEAIYRNLLQDERIDARNRIMYIAACRGGDGFILLGQLQDPYINQRHSASTGPLSGVIADPWVHVPRPGGVYSRKIDAYNPNPSTTGYPATTGSYRTSFDFWVNKLCSNSDWFGWLMPSSCARYSGAVEGSSSAFQTSTIEAMVFYLLAERAGHPVAKQYIDELKRLSGGIGTDPKAAGNELQARAKAKAQTWLAPFEFYAAETRYRGETPSGLVHGDECPINLQRERALARVDRLLPLSSDMLRAIGFYRGAGGPHEYARAVAKYQDMLGDPQTGVLTPMQLTRLIQIMAVRGNAKAQRVLGIMYVKGIGVPVNFVRAEKWLLLAAEQGDGEAMHALAELYTQGADGVEKSEDRAVRYRQGAAVAGFEPTRSELMRLLDTAPSAARTECRTRRCRRERGADVLLPPVLPPPVRPIRN